jgi:YesN/AraC family two-component response regulator
MYKVIIADDEYWVLEKLKKLFNWEAYGFELVAETYDSSAILKLVEDHKPDVLFIDINMPGKSGLDVLKELREQGNMCKVVIISAYSEFEYAQKAIAHGVFEYCLKPVTYEVADSVLQRLREALDLKNNVETESQIGEIENKTFEKMVLYIQQHYREKLQLIDLSKKFHLNVTYCCFLFQKNFQCSFTTFLTNIRMEKAAELLLEDMTTQEIASYLSYDYFYFNKTFKKHFNQTPKQYKKEKLNKINKR